MISSMAFFCADEPSPFRVPLGHSAPEEDALADGEDPELHKAAEWTEPQDTGPWGAYDLSLGKAMYAGFTMGGLATTVDGEVRREDGSTITGLYAAGACAANLAQDAKGYASGMQLGDGSYFGRRAGRHAAGLR